MWEIRQLSTGWWYIRHAGSAGWCQPPSWPMPPDELSAYVHGASRRFEVSVAELNDRAWSMKGECST